MNDNFCPKSDIPDDVDYCVAQVETGIYQMDFPKNKNPWKQYKYFVRVGGGYRGYSKKSEARKYYNAD